MIYTLLMLVGLSTITALAVLPIQFKPTQYALLSIIALLSITLGVGGS